MKLGGYNRFCRALPHATHVVQWGGAHVWKIGGKVFAIGGWNDDDDDELAVTFKCSPGQYDLLEQLRGCRPAPYLASRGMKWIQRTRAIDLPDAALEACLRQSYALAAATLPKKTQRALGIGLAPPKPVASRRARR
jgi:predicted DNA-binding protein (MmcQ/YjbR family)